MIIVVEACMNLSNSTGSPVETNPLTGGSPYFSERQWTKYPSRFDRLRRPQGARAAGGFTGRWYECRQTPPSPLHGCTPAQTAGPMMDSAKLTALLALLFCRPHPGAGGEELGVSVSTAERLWAYARAWLFRAMRQGSPIT